MSENSIGCPQCHYMWYIYYSEVKIPQTAFYSGEEVPLYESIELPVAIKTPRGYLCRLCRYEWKSDGTPVNKEIIEQSIASFRKHGEESYAEIQSSNTKVKSEKK